MKKLIVLLVLALCSCQRSTDTNSIKVLENINYFKDSKTGLCFASLNSITHYGYEVTSISCVPCDSLKHINL